uniref:Coatomer subunit gamma n=1 Tax=Ciona savignyi TaxID=51511 RepID=H2YIY5_CIOSA
SVSSAALVSSLHLTKQAFDVVKRWVNEVQESCSNDSIMVQVSISTNLPCASCCTCDPSDQYYHALGLLYHLRKKDRLATSKMVTKFMKSGMKSPFAYCMLIRIASKLLEEDDSGRDSPLFNFIESCLRNKHELVIYEAASAIVNMPNCSARELAPAVSVLQQFISSAQPSMRFAGVKTLSKVAMKHPSAVTACNLDLENLITDVNRSIATLAITTLLKTGSESSVDRLMKQISSFMSEISDEFKVVVVRAISALCQKYPRQHSVMMSYLASMLRAEGGFEYKKAIVECIISILEDSAESKESGLAHLCEFIEVRSILVLATKIIHLLGREGPKTPNPSKYIRFIYNRVILENEAVRAAAVSALARFGAQCDDLRESILSLLSRSMMDEDDEVRDRATFYFHTLQQQQKALNSAYILNGCRFLSWPSLIPNPSSIQVDIHTCHPFSLSSLRCDNVLFIFPQSPPNPPCISVLTSRKAKEQPTASKQEIYAGNPPVVCHIRMVVNPIPPTSPHFTSSPPPEQLSRIPEFGVLGNLFKSSDAVELTESETEYVVKCTKHTFPHHLVLQFDCTNTLNDQVLEDVTVQVEQSDAFEVIAYVPCPSLPYNQPGVAYACVAIPEGDEVTTTLSCVMKFRVKDCDPNTGEADDDGYDDEYVLEDLDIVVADHVQKVIKSNFGSSWDELGDGNELEDTYALSSLNTLQDAVRDIIKYLGMQACERSDKVPDGKSSHSLFLAGVYRGGHDVLARAKLVLKDGVTMQLTVRSSDAEAARVVTSAVA